MSTTSGDGASEKPASHNPENKMDSEKSVGRNPHPDFEKVQASRPDWHSEATWSFTKTKKPDWKLGDGANDGGQSIMKQHVQIDPYEAGRPAVFNYKLLISAIVPRPIGFVGTISADGKSTNLAPFSYTQMINHDPPLFIIGFSGGFSNAKDTLTNLSATKECTINIISEHFLEAANATSINAPHGVSEWALSGLTPATCTDVKCSRVKEAVFSVEGALVSTQEFESRATPGKKTGVLAIVEGTKFWVREDALNEERNGVDPAVLRPMSRLGGITYGRVIEGCEIPRPDYQEKVKQDEADHLIRERVEGQ
ncbi:MAG: hypothetical protein LQ351_003524 [Letrouitia transgressa]|nr:MAG: hypothetical protein LQ351_003524 [Letrouitia transgressa]